MADAAFAHAWSNLTYVAQEDGPGTLQLAWVITGTHEDGTPFTIKDRTIGYSTYSAAGEAFRMVDAMYELAYGDEDVSFTSVRMRGSITAENLTSPIVGFRVSSPLQRSLRPRDVVRVEITLDPVDGPRFAVVTKIRVPENAHGVRRIDLSGGGTHADDVVVRGFGATSVRGLDVIVRGNAHFLIRVI
jgi:hypothetical protein